MTTLVIWAGAAMAVPAHIAVTGRRDRGLATQGSGEIACVGVRALMMTPARWGSIGDSYSGDVAKMTADPRVCGRFRETIPSKTGGAAVRVEHGVGGLCRSGQPVGRFGGAGAALGLAGRWALDLAKAHRRGTL